MKKRQCSNTRNSTPFNVQRSLLASLLLMFTGLGGHVFASEYYGTGGIYMQDELRDTHGGGTLVQRIDRKSGQVVATSLRDGQLILGPKGENAESVYYGNLATGTVSASVQAANAYDHNDQIWGETSASSWIQMHDTIYFTIPAGTYVDGVAAVVSGYVEGSMADTKLGQSRFSFSAVLNTAQYVLQDSGDFTQPHSMAFKESFTLMDTLVQPGTTLGSDLTVRHGLTISMGSPATLVASTLANKTGLNGEFTSALADFSNTGRILDLSVPEGVTWTSASGVFLSEVPLPSSLLLFSSAIAGLIGFTRKRRHTVVHGRGGRSYI